MFRFIRRPSKRTMLLLAGLAGFAGLAQAGERLMPEMPSPLPAVGLAAEGMAVELGFNEGAYREIKRHSALVLRNFSAAPGRWLDLELEPFFVTGGQTRFVRDGEIAVAAPDVVLLRGKIRGEPGSRVFLGLSPNGSNGWIERPGETYIVTTYAPDAAKPRERITAAYLREETPGSAESPWLCGTDALPVPPRGGGNGEGGVAGVTTCLRAVVALETDYEFYQLFNNTANANAYIVQLIGAVSNIYERDLGIQLEIGFSRLWTSAGDPWNAGADGYAELIEFQNYWNANMTNVNRVTVMKLSARTGGGIGGIAYLEAICYPEYDYALSRYLNGSFPQPLKSNNSANWDPHVVAHEWGHNFGGPHTHDVDPPIDNCANGDCSVTPHGTLMSYCHVCGGGNANLVMEFHERMQQIIKTYTASTVCVTQAVNCEHIFRGDLNCDGVIDFFDIDPFVLAVNDPAAYAAQYPNCDAAVLADINGDSVVDFFDIDGFIALLIG